MTTNDTTLEGILKEFRQNWNQMTGSFSNIFPEHIVSQIEYIISHACEKVRQAEREEVERIILNLDTGGGLYDEDYVKGFYAAKDSILSALSSLTKKSSP